MVFLDRQPIRQTSVARHLVVFLCSSSAFRIAAGASIETLEAVHRPRAPEAYSGAARLQEQVSRLQKHAPRLPRASQERSRSAWYFSVGFQRSRSLQERFRGSGSRTPSKEREIPSWNVQERPCFQERPGASRSVQERPGALQERQDPSRSSPGASRERPGAFQERPGAFQERPGASREHPGALQ